MARVLSAGSCYDDAEFSPLWCWNGRYQWYDSNYGSSYTARNEEHASRILGTAFKAPSGVEDTSMGAEKAQPQPPAQHARENGLIDSMHARQVSTTNQRKAISSLHAIRPPA
jgi:hypothetical protein